MIPLVKTELYAGYFRLETVGIAFALYRANRMLLTSREPIENRNRNMNTIFSADMTNFAQPSMIIDLDVVMGKSANASDDDDEILELVTDVIDGLDA